AVRYPRVVVHLPDAELACGLLPDEVGLAVAVDVAAADDVPVCPRIGQADLRDRRRPVHQPDAGGAVIVLPDEVGFAISVDVAAGDDVPPSPPPRANDPAVSTAPAHLAAGKRRLPQQNRHFSDMLGRVLVVRYWEQLGHSAITTPEWTLTPARRPGAQPGHPLPRNITGFGGDHLRHFGEITS